jgi:hypothetical protein
MTPEQIQKLANMDVCLLPDTETQWNPDAVFLRLVNYGPYLDTPVQGLYEEDGEWFIDTGTYKGVSLAGIEPSQIQVCKVVERWWEDATN